MTNIYDVRDGRARNPANDARSPKLNAKFQQALDLIEKESKRTLTELCNNMFDGIDDSFFELANQAYSNIEQNRYFDAMREIRLKRRRVETGFSEANEEAFKISSILRTTKQAKPASEDSAFETLSIVANDDLEEDVAINTMHTKASSNSKGPLLLAKHRYAYLLSVEHESLTLPFDPRVLAENFAKAARILELEIKERLILLKQFDRFVLVHLGSVIDRANEILAGANILKDLRPSQLAASGKRNQANAAARNTIQKNSNNAPESHDPFDNGILSGEQLFPSLQNLLADIRTRTKARATPGDSANAPDLVTVDTEQLISLLDNLEFQEANNSGAPYDIKSLLDAAIQRKNDQSNLAVQLDQVNEDVINLVSMLFEFILEDYNLAPPIQVLISRLQIPILKVVIRDQGFFSNPTNPARRLLNALAKAGIGWSDENSKSDQALYEQINATVQEIIAKQNEASSAHFKALLDSFEAFIAREDRRSKIVEQRTKEVEEGRLRSEYSKRIVKESIDRVFNDRQHLLPKNVASLIEDGWSRYMFIAHIKDNEEHQWSSSLQVLEDLVWCFEPITNQSDKQRWIKIVPKLVKDVYRGLHSISYQPDQLESVVSELKSSLMLFFKKDPLDTAKRAAQKTPKPAAQPKEEPKSAVARQLDAESKRVNLMLGEVRAFQVGEWFELTLDDQVKRCRLASKLDDLSRYIFVNRTGLKVLETDEVDLARKLSLSQIKLLQSGLLFDRAMHSITKNLRAEVAA